MVKYPSKVDCWWAKTQAFRFVARQLVHSCCTLEKKELSAVISLNESIISYKLYRKLQATREQWRTNRWNNDPLIASLWDGTTHSGHSYTRCLRQPSQWAPTHQQAAIDWQVHAFSELIQWLFDITAGSKFRERLSLHYRIVFHEKEKEMASGSFFTCWIFDSWFFSFSNLLLKKRRGKKHHSSKFVSYFTELTKHPWPQIKNIFSFTELLINFFSVRITP